ncbi:enoyl-CoA hydratase [Burkholderia sp. WAC0059]|uniref:enoyl-CoA hydratase n=1 Tax=Burkholderia sp. WAC0059 TaxID=2066022 RepID=UPI000C7F5787|nr:enoyl-CoA hydratase [Burkholderia sp. WAC0059]PLZ00544.1 enoyl-CoA hydratase [Burkholderia sp. WAC0059]
MTQAAPILEENRDGILVVTLNRPETRNALTFDMYASLDAIFADADTNPAVRAVVLKGAGGKAFASGTDISQFREFSKPQDAIDYDARISRVLDTIERCGKPVIASISGACTGGGAGIAAASDIRLATRDSRIGFPVARTLGNCLSMSNYARLAALIGPAKTLEILFTARLLDAREAQEIGLVNEVVSDAAELEARTEELAAKIASNAPLTLRATKEALRRLRPRLPDTTGQDLLLLCYMSRDFKEGIDAFLTKRQPQWTGT